MVYMHVPDDKEVSVSASIWDKPCSSLLLMLLTSVEPPLDQKVAEDRLLRLLLRTSAKLMSSSLWLKDDYAVQA